MVIYTSGMQQNYVFAISTFTLMKTSSEILLFGRFLKFPLSNLCNICNNKKPNFKSFISQRTQSSVSQLLPISQQNFSVKSLHREQSFL